MTREEEIPEWPAGIHRVIRVPGGRVLVAPDVDLKELRDSGVVGRIMAESLGALTRPARLPDALPEIER